MRSGSSLKLSERGPESTCQDAADINNDADVNASDAVYLLNYQFAGGPSPPSLSVDSTQRGMKVVWVVPGRRVSVLESHGSAPLNRRV
jgi:hypothetical protein